MVELNATIQNRQGIHCRPSAEIYKAVKDYTGRIRVSAETGDADLKSMMGLIALALAPDTAISIAVDGPDEESVCQQLVDLFQTEFDFPNET
jgi:phosphocarrier protein HPr